ncbi:hypothetical protein QBC39DRAFT_434839, partial [Podospora conica]
MTHQRKQKTSTASVFSSTRNRVNQQPSPLLPVILPIFPAIGNGAAVNDLDAASQLSSSTGSSSGGALRYATAPEASSFNDTLGPFPGAIIIEGNRHHPERAVRSAMDASNHQNNPDEAIRLSIFADGSFSRQDNDGAYAIVWNRPAIPVPDQRSTAPQEHREMWYVDGEGLTSVICELLALLLALRTMKAELELIMAARQPSDEVLPVTATIYTDSRSNLQHLVTGYCVNPVQRNLLRLCWEAARDLQGVAGLCVWLQMRWIPSHMDDLNLRPRLHWKVDALAGISRGMRRSFRETGAVSEHLTGPVESEYFKNEDSIWYRLRNGSVDGREEPDAGAGIRAVTGAAELESAAVEDRGDDEEQGLGGCKAAEEERVIVGLITRFKPFVPLV